MDGSVVYMRVPRLHELGMAPTEWVSMDLSRTVPGYADMMEIGTGQSDPTNAFGYLQGAEQAEEVGTEVVNGVEATHYEVSVSLSTRSPSCRTTCGERPSRRCSSSAASSARPRYPSRSGWTTMACSAAWPSGWTPRGLRGTVLDGDDDGRHGVRQRLRARDPARRRRDRRVGAGRSRRVAVTAVSCAARSRRASLGTPGPRRRARSRARRSPSGSRACCPRRSGPARTCTRRPPVPGRAR